MNPMTNRGSDSSGAAAVIAGSMEDHHHHHIDFTNVSPIPHRPDTTSTTVITTKLQQIECAIRTKNIWFLRSLALSSHGFMNGTL